MRRTGSRARRASPTPRPPMPCGCERATPDGQQRDPRQQRQADRHRRDQPDLARHVLQLEPRGRDQSGKDDQEEQPGRRRGACATGRRADRGGCPDAPSRPRLRPGVRDDLGCWRVVPVAADHAHVGTDRYALLERRLRVDIAAVELPDDQDQRIAWRDFALPRLDLLEVVARRLRVSGVLAHRRLAREVVLERPEIGRRVLRVLTGQPGAHDVRVRLRPSVGRGCVAEVRDEDVRTHTRVERRPRGRPPARSARSR